MFIIYNFLLIILAIIFLPVILIAFIVQPKFRAGFWQKLGFYNLNLDKTKKTIWVHAVSVGEVNAVEGFIKKARQEFCDANIVLSTVTRTGQAVANSKLANFTDEIIYFPYDFTFSVKAAIKAINPDIAIVAETEIWPGFANELYKCIIPLWIINGRISPSSYKGYKKFKMFFKNILSKYSLILMQSQGDKERIIDIGAPSDITEVMGNLKFDITNILKDEDIEDLKQNLQVNDSKVLIAGSTHAGEDEIVLEVFKKLKKDFADLKLLLAPRHPERNENVYKLIQETRLASGKISQQDTFADNEIIMLDTMGELGKMYSISHLAFIGGSYSNTGGHNPLEAAIYNVPTLSGPTVFNFKDIYKILTAEQASIIADDEAALYASIKELMLDNEKYNKHSQACKAIFTTSSGALDFAIDKLKSVL